MSPNLHLHVKSTRKIHHNRAISFSWSLHKQKRLAMPDFPSTHRRSIFSLYFLHHNPIHMTAIDTRVFPGSSSSWVVRSRSEEHTSELQSRGHLVCRLLLE